MEEVPLKNKSRSKGKSKSNEKRYSLAPYLHFAIPLEDDSNKISVYPTRNHLERFGYQKYNPVLRNTTGRIYEEESLVCYIGDHQKAYGRNREPREDSLKVMTWNVHNWVQTCVEGEKQGPMRRVDAFVDFIQAQGPDVVCLQEVVPVNPGRNIENITSSRELRKMNFRHICALFEARGYKYRVIANANVDATNLSNMTGYYYLGNAIFSKIPIQKYYLFGIPYNRNVLIAKILYQGRAVYVTNTHLEYYHYPIAPAYSRYELYQKLDPEEKKSPFQINLKVMMALLEKIRSKNVIVCGDFNHTYWLKRYRHMRFSIGARVFQPFMKEYMDTTRYPHIQRRATNLRSREEVATDFVFLKKEADLRVDQSFVTFSDLSDHYPVFTSFTWK